MDVGKARLTISSTVPSDRLEAARVMARAATSADIPLLRRALHAEEDGLISRTLTAALATARADMPIAVSDETSGPRAQAIAQVTAMIDHELRPILGAAKYQAERELLSYASSKLRRELEQLEHALDAFRKLGQAARSPRPEAFDVAQLAEDLVEGVRKSHEVSVDIVGGRPFTVIGDPDLVLLVVVNALRNAADSVCDVRADKRREPEIIVKWDANDAEYWVAILDEGGGLPERRERIFEAGITTRADHIGMGLAIAQQAADSLGGKVSLENREPRGAHFILSWPRDR